MSPQKMRLVGQAIAQAGTSFFVAEVALHRHLRVFIKLHSPERTGLDAFLAPDTDIIVNENNARLISQPP